MFKNGFKIAWLNMLSTDKLNMLYNLCCVFFFIFLCSFYEVIQRTCHDYVNTGSGDLKRRHKPCRVNRQLPFLLWPPYREERGSRRAENNYRIW